MGSNVLFIKSMKMTFIKVSQEIKVIKPYTSKILVVLLVLLKTSV